MIHDLKTDPVYFERVFNGEKTFEVRKDDRGYQSGDTLILREFDRTKCTHPTPSCRPREEGGFGGCPGFTGRVVRCSVGFIFKAGVGVDLGEYVVMSLLNGPEVAS